MENTICKKGLWRSFYQKKICKKEYNDKHKGKIKEYSRNCYHSGNQKAKAKEYHEKKLPEYAKMYHRNLSETRK